MTEPNMEKIHKQYQTHVEIGVGVALVTVAR